jgi:hypothetical protein
VESDSEGLREKLVKDDVEVQLLTVLIVRVVVFGIVEIDNFGKNLYTMS